MIEITAQIKKGVLYPFSEQDAQKLSEYLENQPLRLKISGFRKPRVVEQIAAFHCCCEDVAENVGGENLDTMDKVKEYVKLKCGFVKCRTVIDGVVNIKTRSMAFKNLPHMEACKLFDKGFKVIAGLLGISIEELEDRIKSKRKF